MSSTDAHGRASISSSGSGSGNRAARAGGGGVVLGPGRPQLEDKNISFNAKSKMSEATESTASYESFMSSRSKLSTTGNLVGLSVLGTSAVSGSGNGNGNGSGHTEFRGPEFVVAEYDDEDGSSSSDEDEHLHVGNGGHIDQGEVYHTANNQDDAYDYDDINDGDYQDVFQGEYHPKRRAPRQRPPSTRMPSVSVSVSVSGKAKDKGKPFNSNSTMSSNSSSDIQARMMAQAAMNSQLAAELMENHDVPNASVPITHSQRTEQVRPAGLYPPQSSPPRARGPGGAERRELLHYPVEFTVSRSHLEVPEYELNGRALSEVQRAEMSQIKIQSQRQSKSLGPGGHADAKFKASKNRPDLQKQLHSHSAWGLSCDDYEESILRAQSMASASFSDMVLESPGQGITPPVDGPHPVSVSVVPSGIESGRVSRYSSSKSGDSAQRRSSFGSNGIEAPAGKPAAEAGIEPKQPRRESAEIAWRPPPCFGAPEKPISSPAPKETSNKTAAQTSFSRQFGMDPLTIAPMAPSPSFDPHQTNAKYQQFETPAINTPPVDPTSKTNVPQNLRISSKVNQSPIQRTGSEEAEDIVSTVSGMVQRDVGEDEDGEDEEDDLSVISDITGMTGWTARQAEEVDEDDTLQNRPGRFSKRRPPQHLQQPVGDVVVDEEIEQPPILLPSHQRPPRRPLVSREVHEPHGIQMQPKLLKKAIPSNSDRRRKLNLRVTFGDVQIRLYERAIMLNPSVTSGPAIGLGWRYQSPSYVYRVDDIEEERYAVRRPSNQLVLSKKERVEILDSFGFSAAEIAEGTRLSLRGKNQRRKTVNNLENRAAVEVEELVDFTTRTVKKLLRVKKGSTVKKKKSRLDGKSVSSNSSNGSFSNSNSYGYSQGNLSMGNLSSSTGRRSILKRG